MTTVNLAVRQSRKSLPMQRPIRTERELAKSTAIAFQLSEKGETRRLTRDESDYLEVLLLLIQDFENGRYRIKNLSNPRQRLVALTQESGLSASDLGRLLGNRALGSKLLTGERELSKTHIKQLAAHFHVEPGFFL